MPCIEVVEQGHELQFELSTAPGDRHLGEAMRGGRFVVSDVRRTGTVEVVVERFGEMCPILAQDFFHALCKRETGVTIFRRKR